MNRKKPELLLPAGGPDVLKTALDYGADAVYLGGDAFGLRASAKNFSDEELIEAVRYTHSRGKKVYVTANIFAHNDDIAEAESYFRFLKEAGPDAVLISDPGMFMTARRVCPGIDIHISTQANNVNYETCLFWYGLGAKRIVTGRELSLAEIRGIRERIPDDLELESFVHGAMCISYSGRCLLSSFLAGRDANRGACTHPCRWQYTLEEEKRPGEHMPVFENERGTFIFNSKDLCMIDHIPELAEAGISSLKIEGRMKTALYAAVTARAYRMAIDDYYKDPDLYRERLDVYRAEIAKCTYREFTTGFYFGKPGADAQIYDSNTYVRNSIYLGTVEEVDGEGCAHFIQKNRFFTGDTVELMRFDGTNTAAKVLEIIGEDGVSRDSAPHPKEALRVRFSALPAVGELIRSEPA